MAISKRLRFEVLRRDNHTCRYCGRGAPEVKLTIDHVTPEALGGTDTPGNLVTACSECNGGKTSIAPDSPLVANVAEDALRWAQAMVVAGEQMLADMGQRRAAHAEFDRWWSDYTYGPENDRQKVPRPDGWRSSVDSFLAAGLPMPVLYDCLVKAMDNEKVKASETFRYMCGIGWSRVTEIQQAAQCMVGGGPASDPLIVTLTEEQSGCTNCMGAGELPLTVLDLVNSSERADAIAKAKATPVDERTYEDEAAEAACIAVSHLFDTRFQLDNAARLLFENLPEDIRKPVYAVADAEVSEHMGDDFTDCDLVTNRLRHLCIWVNLNFAPAKAGV